MRPQWYKRHALRKSKTFLFARFLYSTMWFDTFSVDFSLKIRLVFCQSTTQEQIWPKPAVFGGLFLYSMDLTRTENVVC